ncbi:MAG: hypothetical protein Q9167_007354 [Letrouitia subvulpina]
MADILGQPAKVKANVEDVVDKYMLSSENNLDGSVHTALDTTNAHVKLDPDRQKWVEREPQEETNLEYLYKNVEQEQNSLLQALEEYQNTIDPKDNAAFDLSKNHTMAQVWAMVDAAAKKYDTEDIKGV